MELIVCHELGGYHGRSEHDGKGVSSCMLSTLAPPARSALTLDRRWVLLCHWALPCHWVYPGSLGVPRRLTGASASRACCHPHSSQQCTNSAPSSCSHRTSAAVPTSCRPSRLLSYVSVSSSACTLACRNLPRTLYHAPNSTHTPCEAADAEGAARHTFASSRCQKPSQSQLGSAWHTAWSSCATALALSPHWASVVPLWCVN